MGDDYDLTKDEIEVNISESLKNVLVFGHSPAFGLKWRTGNAEFTDVTLGSWLNRKTGKKNTQLFFYTLDDEAEAFVQNKSEYDQGKNPPRFQFKDIKDVHVRVTYEPYSVSFVVECETSGKKGDTINDEWTLAPIQDNDPEVLINWVSALRHRAKLFDDDLLLASNKALKAAVWAQSRYRKWKATDKVSRRRERREGVVNNLKAAAFSLFYGGDGFYDTDSDSEDEGDNVKRVQEEEGYGFTSLITAIMGDTYYGISEEAEANQVLNTSTAKTTRGKDTLQKRYDAEAISMDEIEDEVWENQTWSIAKKKWLPADFSDRIYRNKKKTLEAVAPVPKNWEITREFEIDLSGLTRKGCGKDGWILHSSFAKLNDDFMAGRVHIKPSPNYVCRRRRWFQRRKYVGSNKAESKVIWHGYLRRKSETTGRWNTRYYVLTKGLVQNGNVTGVCISQFRKNVTDHLNIIGRRDMDQLAALTDKEIKTWNLEASVLKKISNKQAKFGWTIKVPARKNTLTLSVATKKDFDDWFYWIQHLVNDQDKHFTLTKQNVEAHQVVGGNAAYSEIPLLDWIILDQLVPTTVDEFAHLAFFDTQFQQTLQKKLQTKEYKELQSWTDGQQNGSRRKVEYILPKQKSKIGSVSKVPRTKITEKFKVEKYTKGEGIFVVSSIEFHDIPYGNIFQLSLRTVIADWKKSRARVCVSMNVDLRAEDDNIKGYLTSLMRAYMLQYYVDTWMPLCSKAIKHRQQTAKPEVMPVVTPTGMEYKKLKNL
mmetsp:Transcript_5981/g.7129  ORF Transcript_5981/g.7129 Transcript_5981/m.7129 type:complete len:765 (+) Transcript_5981:157-2451(+)